MIYAKTLFDEPKKQEPLTFLNENEVLIDPETKQPLAVKNLKKDNPEKISGESEFN